MPRFHHILMFSAAVLAAVGCGPSQADIDRANKLNALSEQRAAQEALQHLDELEAEEAADEAQTGEGAPATAQSPAEPNSEN